MITCNANEVPERFSSLLDSAVDEVVMITRSDGRQFKLVSMPFSPSARVRNHQAAETTSPLAPLAGGRKINITTEELIELLHEGR